MVLPRHGPAVNFRWTLFYVRILSMVWWYLWMYENLYAMIERGYARRVLRWEASKEPWEGWGRFGGWSLGVFSATDAQFGSGLLFSAWRRKCSSWSPFVYNHKLSIVLRRESGKPTKASPCQSPQDASPWYPPLTRAHSFPRWWWCRTCPFVVY